VYGLRVRAVDQDLDARRTLPPEPLAPDPAHPTAAYLHGFIMDNLSRKFSSEQQMLRLACNSGEDQNFYQGYFVDGSVSHAAPSFHLIANPYAWTEAPVSEAFPDGSLAKKMGHCLKDLFPSVMPGPMAAADRSRTDGFAFWSHNEKGCPKDALTVRIALGQKRESYCCFKTHP
jgi:hypothetical protein